MDNSVLIDAVSKMARDAKASMAPHDGGAHEFHRGKYAAAVQIMEEMRKAEKK